MSDGFHIGGVAEAELNLDVGAGLVGALGAQVGVINDTASQNAYTVGGTSDANATKIINARATPITNPSNFESSRSNARANLKSSEFGEFGGVTVGYALNFGLLNQR